MKIIKKMCDGCGELRLIWKNKEGKRYCKQCWSAHSVTTKVKPTQKRISPRSPKRIKQDLLYSQKRKVYLSSNPMCKAHLPTICTQTATDIHHMAGRIGELYLDETYWVALCRACHSYVEAHPKEARDMGLSVLRLNK
jgi:hypothetical protein